MLPFYNFSLTPSVLGHIFKASFQKHHRKLKPLFERFIPKNGYVIDVGGHAGQFSKLFSEIAPQGRIFTFEPASYARIILRIALIWNRKRNVVVIPAGLAARSGCEMLHIPMKRKSSMGFGLSHMGNDKSGCNMINEPIALLSLDDFILKAKILRVDFIKVDIEGWELQMLEGAKDTLTKFKPTIMIELDETHLHRAGNDLASAWNFLTTLGYRPHILDDKLVLQELFQPRSGDIWWIFHQI